MTMPRVLAMATAVAASLQLLSHAPAGSAGMLAAMTVVLAGLALALLAHGAGITGAVASRPLTSRTRALREKSYRAAFQRQLNPDAEGHPRPRAPGAAPAAA
jgi:hypothetical protein